MVRKNEIIRMEIQSVSSDGNGVGRHEGIAVFVPYTAVGDVLDVRIVKVMKTYAYGIIDKVITPSADRVENDCPHYGKCGGCCFRHISYDAELGAKQAFVEDALKRIGGIDCEVNQIIASPSVDRYRNKVQFPVMEGNEGIFPAFYSQRSHRGINISDSCLLQPSIMNEVAVEACRILSEIGETVYDEITNEGNIRHILIRKSSIDGSVLVCVVCCNGSIKEEELFVKELVSVFPDIKTIVINRNNLKGNGILTREKRIIFGNGVIEDEICDVPVSISYDSFFQINHEATVNLYSCVKNFCDTNDDQTIIDLYCGMGTIGLSVSDKNTSLYGIDIVESSIESARISSAKMMHKNANFITGDSDMIQELMDRGIIADTIITDPPRKGCSESVLRSLSNSNADRIIMVSCNPSTLARDLRFLCDNGYSISEVQPYDMFPRTKHIETIVLLQKLNS